MKDTMTDLLKSDTFKLILVLCATLAVQIVGLVRWGDILTPNWVGATMGQLALNIGAAFGIQFTLRSGSGSGKNGRVGDRAEDTDTDPGT